MDQDKIEHELLIFQQGAAPVGGVLQKALANLSPDEITTLRRKAAEGTLSIELDSLRMRQKFVAKNADIDELIQAVKRIEESRGGLTTYRVKGEYEGASGKTTIEVKRGVCYVATYVYGDEQHPNVVALREFRDETLIKYSLGRAFCSVYSTISPRLLQSRLFCILIYVPAKACINAFCYFLK